MKLLHIDSSILGGQFGLAPAHRSALPRSGAPPTPAPQVDYLDLAADAPSHLSADSLGFRAPAGTGASATLQRRENAVSERLVSQFLAADVVVVGAPLYNFSIPSQLKAWIDRMAQVGRTFKYTDKGPVGLAGGKTVIVASTPRRGVFHQRRRQRHGAPGELPARRCSASLA
ncbi:MAG: NAD(P)H-dependent oxidoreductase [Gemmatimonadales bacterium]